MLIGLVGKAGSGKDTVFKRSLVIAKKIGIPNPERVAFADKLKESAAAALGLSEDAVNYYKGDSGTGHITILGKPMSMRRFLQLYGTESHRDVFGDNFWVNAALPLGFDHAHKIVFVTDIRFENEAERIRLLGGKIVQVTGPEDLLQANAAGHVSESGIADVDYEIDNTDRSWFDDLDKQITSIMASFNLAADVVLPTD